MAQGFLWTRRAMLAVVVVMLSLAGHAAGSEMLPNSVGFVLAMLLATALTVSVRPGASFIKLFAYLLGVQALLHVIFVLSSTCAPGTAGAMSLVPSQQSVLGHIIASLLAVVVLRHGDQVLSSWTALFAAVFSVPELALPAIAAPAQPAQATWSAGQFGADHHLATQVRRGPPAA